MSFQNIMENELDNELEMKNNITKYFDDNIKNNYKLIEHMLGLCQDEIDNIDSDTYKNDFYKHLHDENLINPDIEKIHHATSKISIKMNDYEDMIDDNYLFYINDKPIHINDSGNGYFHSGEYITFLSINDYGDNGDEFDIKVDETIISKNTKRLSRYKEFRKICHDLSVSTENLTRYITYIYDYLRS